MQNLTYKVIVLSSTRKEVLEKSITRAFKPMLDILTALLKSAQPFIVIFTVVIVAVQLLRSYHSFQKGENLQKHFLGIAGVVFCSTLILTANAWLSPILKKIAGI